MNKIAKVLSVVLSATLALSVAVVMLVSALAAEAPTLSLNVVDETDSTVTIAVTLDKGGFNALDLTVKPAGKNIGQCTDATEGDDFLMFMMKDIKKLGGAGASAVYAETGKLSASVTVAYDKAGTDVAVYTFDKTTADKVAQNDFTFTVESCEVDGNKVNPTTVNNLPAPAVEPTEPATDAPTEPATDAPTEPATDAPTEPATDAPTEPATEAPTEPETDAPTEPATEAPTEPKTDAPAEPATDAPTEATSATTAGGTVSNPSTGDSVSAIAAVVSLFAVSAAAVVALRKKED